MMGARLALAGCDGAAKAFGGGERGTGDRQIGFSYAGGTDSIQGTSESPLQSMRWRVVTVL